MSRPLFDKLKELDPQQLANLYKTVFDNADAKLVLEDLKNRCFYYAPLPFGEQGMRSEGMRQVVLTIESFLEDNYDAIEEGQQ